MNRLREVGGEEDLLDHRALRHLQKKGVFFATGIRTTKCQPFIIPTWPPLFRSG